MFKVVVDMISKYLVTEGLDLDFSIIGKVSKRNIVTTFSNGTVYKKIVYYTILYYTILYYTILYYAILFYFFHES